MLAAHPEVRLFIGLDVDPTAHRLTRQRLQDSFPDRITFPDTITPERVSADGAPGPSLAGGGPSRDAAHGTAVFLVRDNFRNVDRAVRGAEGVAPGSVDGILLDIGVSSMQIDLSSRGFSFLHDGPLDMRMDPDASLTAEQVVNEWSEQELGRVLREFGEERQWRLLARRIVEARWVGPITSTAQLATVLSGGRPRSPAKSYFRSRGPKAGIHPATRAFQGLRIAVNGELDALKEALPRAVSLLAPGGRLAVITFHSLEDRIVKHGFLEAARTPSDACISWERGTWDLPGSFKVVTNKPISASDDEVALNSRSRSAKLRILERNS